MSPLANRTPVTSSSTIGNGDNDHQIWIVPEEDGFDPHKIVIDGLLVAFVVNLNWLEYPHGRSFHNLLMICSLRNSRRNFEKRASARMTQLFQDVRKNLPLKPHWMGDAVFKEMKGHWESPAFKIKSEQNKKTVIQMLVHHFIQKESTGKDPSISEFYFRTHRKKSDKSWVNEKAETAYNTFERKKQELLASQSASAAEGETNLAGQPSQLTEMDIWVESVGGKKKGRVKGLRSLGRSVKSLSKQSTSALSREIDEMIKAQDEEGLDLLKKHVYNASSSNEHSSQEDNQAYENESGDDSDSVNDSGSTHDNVNDSGSAHYSASSSNGDS
ncbi:hypothetical protein KY289_026406 [Solanum tuberosum]|nr:hypothetical protein KY289_026406 [Solanum tuberosum]